MPKHFLELSGAGGEPVDLWRTIVSHGVASLPPARVDEEARTFEYTLPQGWFRLADGAAETRGPGVLPVVRHMLRLDEDLSGFYARATGWRSAGFSECRHL